MVGRLPQCEAHQLLTLAPVQLPSSTKHSSHGSQVQHKPHQRMDSEEHYQMELAIAMSASLAGQNNATVGFLCLTWEE